MRSTSSLLFVVIGALAACASGGGGPTTFQKSSYADPDSLAGDYLQGHFAASQHHFGQAASAYSRAVTRQPDRPIVASAFHYALATGDMDKARVFAERLLAAPAPEATHDQPSASPFLDRDLARLVLLSEQFRQEDYAAARPALEDPFESSLGRSIGHLLEGWAVFGDEDAEAAVEALNDFGQDTFAGFTPLHIAMMLDLEDRVVPAEVAYAQAMQAPGSNIAVLAYSGYAERHKSREEALELYSNLSAERGYLRRIGRLGLARMGQPLKGETRQFRRVAENASLRAVSSAREGAAMGLVNFAWSAYDQAFSRRQAAVEAGFGDLPLNLEVPLTLAQLAAAIDEDQAAAHYLVGAIMAYYRQYEESVDAYARIKPRSWLYNYAVIDRAEAQVSLGRRDEAIDLIKDYLRQDALAPDVYLELADLLVEEERIDEALAATESSIRIAEQLTSDENRQDNLWRYYFARGAIASQADRWEIAEPSLKQSLALSPEEPIVLNFLGYSYVERGENLEEALGMIEKALAEQPNSGSITDSLGWAYYQMGDYRKAVEYLERAVALQPGDDVITDHLGDAYWQMGRKADARYEWRRVLEIDGLEAELKGKVERKLEGEAPAAGQWANGKDSADGDAGAQ